MSEYQAEKRRDEEASRKRAADDERSAREMKREEAARNAKREAVRNKEASERRDREKVREQERQDNAARTEREERERDARKSKAQAERDAQTAREQARREEEARRDAQTQAVLAKEAEKKKENDKLGENRYAELLKDLGASARTAKRINSIAKNPFEAGGRYLGRALDKSLLDVGLDASTPLGEEKHDATYDHVSTGVNRARATALKSNPFAREISGLAMNGVDKINRQVLGELDREG